MRQVRVSEYGKKADGSCVGACLTDTETGRDVICPLSGRYCTPDCAAFERDSTRAYCHYIHAEQIRIQDDYYYQTVIGELVEEEKP